jgi:hypothetical protein
MNQPAVPEPRRKLGITPDQRVAVITAPPECALAISVADGSEPDRADVVIGFITRRADLDLLSPVSAAATPIAPPGSPIPSRASWAPILLGTGLPGPFVSMASR